MGVYFRFAMLSFKGEFMKRGLLAVFVSMMAVAALAVPQLAFATEDDSGQSQQAVEAVSPEGSDAGAAQGATVADAADDSPALGEVQSGGVPLPF